MTDTYTAGPWLAKAWTCHASTSVMSGTNQIAECAGLGYHEANHEANARLNAAAPELLDALTKLVEFSGMLAESPEGSKAVESARTAIAKATQNQ